MLTECLFTIQRLFKNLFQHTSPEEVYRQAGQIGGLVLGFLLIIFETTISAQHPLSKAGIRMDSHGAEGDRDIGVAFQMELDQTPVIHLIDMIA